MDGDDVLVWPLASPLVTAPVMAEAAVTAVRRGLFRVFSGTFSFCAAVSTEVAFTLVVIPDNEDTDEAGVGVFFCGFFFLLPLDEMGFELGATFEVKVEGLTLEVKVEGLLLPPLTVSREEMSNMVGTERNSCCVIPSRSSSEGGGDGADGPLTFSPTFFFLHNDEVAEERSGGSEEEADKTGGEGLEESWLTGFAGAVWLDQADLALDGGLMGRILETRAGKSSSWKEEVLRG